MALAELGSRQYRSYTVIQTEAGSMAQTPKPTAAKPARAARSATGDKPARPVKADKPARPVKADKPLRAAKAAKPAASTAVTAARAAPAARPDRLARKTAAAAVETIKLRNLVDTVAAATGAKKPDAKVMIEAVLAALGTGLAAKSVFVVPPLGKLRVAKSNGSVLTLKLRLADTSRAAGLALAEDDEDS
jgi:DNA-binding protein HU-alpha